jgi:hypothetical protein
LWHLTQIYPNKNFVEHEKKYNRRVCTLNFAWIMFLIGLSMESWWEAEVALTESKDELNFISTPTLCPNSDYERTKASEWKKINSISFFPSDLSCDLKTILVARTFNDGEITTTKFSRIDFCLFNNHTHARLLSNCSLAFIGKKYLFTWTFSFREDDDDRKWK